MRVFGRAPGSPTWVVVETDANGQNDAVFTTALCQVILLNLQESPFYANYGIPAVPSIVTQIAPNYYAMQIQAQYAQYFANLLIAAVPGTDSPTYSVKITYHNGAVEQMTVAQ